MRKGTKHDSGKPDTSLIPVEFILETAKALTFGKQKYGAHNYREGIELSSLLAAAERHLLLEKAGVPQDLESGFSHLAHALASLAMYTFMKHHRPEMNDLFKYTESEIKSLEEFTYGKPSSGPGEESKGSNSRPRKTLRSKSASRGDASNARKTTKKT